MQIGGLGGSHSASDHHVTNCIHDHHDTQKDTGGMTMKSSASAEVSAARSELLQEEQFSLTAWLRNALGNGRGLLLNFWRDGQTTDGVQGSSKATAGSIEGSQAAIQSAAHTENSGTAAAVAIQPDSANSTGYRPATERMKHPKRTLWQKARDHFHNMSGRSYGKRSQRFFDLQTRKSSCQVRREQPGDEDLRRHNRYRRDTVEISVAQIEDDYLMDSYDRRGEYSQLTTKK